MTAWYVGLTLTYVLITFLLPDYNPGGHCEGVGWGCVPTPRDSAWLVGLFVVVPGVMIGYWLSLGVYALLYARFRPAARRHPTLAGTGAAFSGMFAGVLIALVFAAATLT